MTKKLWSEEDDHKLWSLRLKPISQLALIFDKTYGAIQSRLKHLNDPNHKAYQRRVKNATGHIMEADEKCFISALDLNRLERMISELPPPGGQGGS